jgi:hypothetical protein
LHEFAFSDTRDVTPQSIGTLFSPEVATPIEAQPDGLIARLPGALLGWLPE